MMSAIIKINLNFVCLIHISYRDLCYPQKISQVKISYAITYGIYIQVSVSNCA
jgi:hypothetical protein